MVNDTNSTAQYINDMENELARLKNESSQNQNNYAQLSMYQSGQPANLAELQLDLAKEKKLIEHILRAHTLKLDERGVEYWEENNDPRKKIFTEYGVDRIMNFINIYLSLNIILSYYEPEQIMEKMLAIADELADTFFLEYEYIFYKPTLQDLYDSDGYTEEILNKMDKITLDKLNKDLIYEAQKVYAKNKRQTFMIHNMLVNTVHSAYNRALYGKERESLRKMMHISENNTQRPTNGMNPINSNPNSKFKWYDINSW